LRDCDSYNGVSWETEEDIPSSRMLLAASTIGSSGYIYGGLNSVSSSLQDCDSYNGVLWRTESNMLAPGRHGLAAATLGFAAYIYGSAFNSTQCDSYNTTSWESEADLLLGRGYMASATRGSSSYICGGTTLSGLDCDAYNGISWSSKANMLLPGRHSFVASTIVPIDESSSSSHSSSSDSSSSDSSSSISSDSSSSDSSYSSSSISSSSSSLLKSSSSSSDSSSSDSSSSDSSSSSVSSSSSISSSSSDLSSSSVLEDLVLLLHCDGVEGSTTFIDSGVSAHTVTATRAAIDTSIKKFGTGSLNISTAGELTIPDSNDWDFGSGDFTIDLQMHDNNFNNGGIVYQRSSYSSGNGWSLYCLSNFLTFEVQNAGTIQLTASLSDYVSWLHVAVVRSGDTWSMYINGMLQDSQIKAYTIASQPLPLRIGDGYSSNYDEIRILKNTAAWTSDFTPPISPY